MLKYYKAKFLFLNEKYTLTLNKITFITLYNYTRGCMHQSIGFLSLVEVLDKWSNANIRQCYRVEKTNCAIVIFFWKIICFELAVIFQTESPTFLLRFDCTRPVRIFKPFYIWDNFLPKALIAISGGLSKRGRQPFEVSSVCLTNHAKFCLSN